MNYFIYTSHQSERITEKCSLCPQENIGQNKQGISSYFNHQNANSLCWDITLAACVSFGFLVRFKVHLFSVPFSYRSILSTPYVKFNITWSFPEKKRIYFPLTFLTWPFTRWVSGLLFASCNLIRSPRHLARKSSNVLLVLSICLRLRHMTHFLMRTLSKHILSRHRMPLIEKLIYTVMYCTEGK